MKYVFILVYLFVFSTAGLKGINDGLSELFFILFFSLILSYVASILTLKSIDIYKKKYITTKKLLLFLLLIVITILIFTIGFTIMVFLAKLVN